MYVCKRKMEGERVCVFVFVFSPLPECIYLALQKHKKMCIEIDNFYPCSTHKWGCVLSSNLKRLIIIQTHKTEKIENLRCLCVENFSLFSL